MNNTKRNSEVAIFVCHDLIGLMITNDLVPKLKETGCTPVIVNTGVVKNRKPTVPPPPGPSFHVAGIVDQALLPFLDQLQPEQIPSGKNLSYKHMAKAHGLKYLEISDVNDATFLEAMQNDPNLIGGISVRFLQVFGRQAIDIFEEKGFLWNLHGGLLPQYQGLLIPYRAIYNNEDNYGWTLHKMAEKIDSGDVIDVVTKPLNKLSSVFSIYARMVPHGATMIAGALKDFLTTSSYPYSPQSLEKARYYPYPTNEEMQKYERMGISFVGDLETHINTIVQNFLDPKSPLGRNLKRALCSATLTYLQTNERTLDIAANQHKSPNTGTTPIGDRAVFGLAAPAV